MLDYFLKEGGIAKKLIPQQKERPAVVQQILSLASFPCTALPYKQQLQFKNLVKNYWRLLRWALMMQD